MIKPIVNYEMPSALAELKELLERNKITPEGYNGCKCGSSGNTGKCGSSRFNKY